VVSQEARTAGADRARSPRAERLDAEYVLPLRWTAAQSAADLGELAAYLRRLGRHLHVTVVDGSPDPVFERHAAAFGPAVQHVRPLPWPGANGKVAGVVTGVRVARCERVVLADDDVRYDLPALARVVALLDGADLVRPQNVFDPMPWHARWDTGRSLLNRALGHDHPGTFGVRRSRFLGMGGYDGDVLFENLELSRTVAGNGGREVDAPDVLVRRLPPTTRHFLGQRVRQAYDGLAQPARFGAELSVAPLLLLAAARGRLRVALTGLAAATVATAEVGRRRHGGRAAFPRTAALWAPAWLGERAVCAWVALGRRATGGVPYAGGRLLTAAHATRDLARRPRPPLTALRAGERLPGPQAGSLAPP
jgi:hypothetical protein